MVTSKRRPDAPRPLLLLGIAGLGLAAGFGVARASLDVDRAALASRSGAQDSDGADAPDAADAQGNDADDTDDTAGAEPSAGDALDDAPPAAPDAAAAIAEGDTPPADDTIAEPPPSAEPTPSSVPSAQPTAASSGSGPGRIAMGRVAYIRCDGLPGGACPRELSVERRAWDAIRELADCPGLAGRSGEADVRIVFDGPRMSGLGFRDLGPGALDREAIRACLEPRLGGLRSGSGASRMTVAFAFTLER